jgi:hypothetical protein
VTITVLNPPFAEFDTRVVRRRGDSSDVELGDNRAPNVGIRLSPTKATMHEARPSSNRAVHAAESGLSSDR